MSLSRILYEISACRMCEAKLPHGARPILRASRSARLLIISQAPGSKVHETGIPWNDASGDRLRDWTGLNRSIFYDQRKIAILPIGFCYPGAAANGGDKPPRPECAPLWHGRVLDHLPNLQLTLLVGQYSQKALSRIKSEGLDDGDGKGISRIWSEVLPNSTSELAKRNLDAKTTLV